jgi:hypothetical protein
MDKKKLAEKIKQRVKEFRAKNKHKGTQAKNVSNPKDRSKEADASKLQQKHKKVVAVGPKGGKYVQTVSGHKDYEKSLVKGKIKEIVMEQEFLENFKKERQMEEIKKAVTAEAAPVDNKAADEASLNAENKPSIQDAKTPAEVIAEAAKPIEQAAAPAEAPKAEEAKPKKELSFDGLFAEGFTLGTTLKQNPNGGNMVSNMKKPKMDYVAAAQHSRNEKLTAEDIKNPKKK